MNKTIMTPQKAVNKVYKYFIVDKNPRSVFLARDGKLTCMFRGLKGEKCGVGCLIPNKEYQPNFDATGLRNVIEALPHRFDLKDWGFYNDIMDWHDVEKCGRRALRLICKAHGLVYPGAKK